MKRLTSLLLVLALLLCLCASALAEDGVSIEVIKMDGVSTTTLTPEEDLVWASALDERESGLVLPALLTRIEEEAFVGIAAEKIDDTAFEKCEGVTVYGVKGTEAERIAKLCGFAFVELKPEIEIEIPTAQKMPAAPVLPAVPLG